MDTQTKLILVAVVLVMLLVLGVRLYEAYVEKRRWTDEDEFRRWLSARTGVDWTRESMKKPKHRAED